MSDKKAVPAPVKCLVTIVDRGLGETAIDVLNPVYKTEYMIILGKGTASSEIMDYLGLDEPEKDVLIALFPHQLEKRILHALAQEMALAAPGKGIAFTLPLDGISAALRPLLEESTFESNPTLKEDVSMNEKKFALIAAVVPHGESDIVVDAAHAAGARGGTMLRARSVGHEDVTRFFHIHIQPEKEVIFTLVPTASKKAVMQSICDMVLAKTGEKATVFSVPVDEAVGLRLPDEE
ncbi:MAG: hypothetical protein IJE98_03220 [Oscillospiraceae bacterium]|nr:hypothetical protein [Oscillospiraceae bacterium]